MVNYIFRYEVAASIIVIAVILSYFNLNKIKTRVSAAFTALAWQCLCASLSDIASIFLMKNVNADNLWLVYVVNIIYYFMFNAIPLCFYICLYYLSERTKVMSKLKYWLIFGAYLLISLLLFTTPFTHIVFWFDENYVFHHGIVFYVYYVLAIFYMGAGMVHFFRHRKLYSSNQIISLVSFISFCFISTIIQIIFPHLVITGFMLAITILITYLSLENPDDYIDMEMGIYNRMAFIVKAQECFDDNKPMNILALSSENLSHILKSIGETNKRIFYDIVFSYLRDTFEKKNVFRITNEKLAILLPVDDELLANEKIRDVRNFFSDPIVCGNIQVNVPIILKTIQTPIDASTIEDLLDLVEESLAEEVNTENEAPVHADVSLLENRRREHKIIQLLEEAVNDNSFEVVYQPIYCVEKAGYTSVEALVRYKTEEFGYIEPEEFVPLAEKNGLMLKIGSFVFHEVCSFIAKNKLQEKGIEKVHVNLSVIQCMQEKLYEHIFDIMDHYNIDYDYINLNVTETTTIAANEILLRNMKIMQRHNMFFSLDNYGTGLSNTNTLVKFPFKIVKLDKMLVHSAINDEKARIILQKTVSMVKDLGMEVVAEGVEDLGEYDMAIYAGCDYIQGFMFSKPQEPEQFLGFISKQA